MSAIDDLIKRADGFAQDLRIGVPCSESEAAGLLDQLVEGVMLFRRQADNLQDMLNSTMALGFRLGDRGTLLEADVAFLVLRAGQAGSANFRADRWTGMSSNALVALAYGGVQTTMPLDRDDYAACVRTYWRLPRHRKTKEVRAALWAAREAYLRGHPEGRYPASRRAEREQWLREQEERAKLRKRRRVRP